VTTSALRTVTLSRGLTGRETTPRRVDPAKPSVLLLHGMMGGAWQFDILQERLATAGHHTLAINYRGHHGSPSDSELATTSVRDYARDALVGCHHLGGRPVVIGQSLGGLVSLVLAETGIPSAAVLVCALPPRGVLWRPRRLTGAARPIVAALRRRELLPDRAELDPLILNGLPLADRQEVFDRQVPESSRVFLEVAAGAIAVDRRLVTCPVLSVTAGQDGLVQASVGHRLARRYRTDLVHVDDAAHYAAVAEPTAPVLASAILDWIERKEPST